MLMWGNTPQSRLACGQHSHAVLPCGQKTHAVVWSNPPHRGLARGQKTHECLPCGLKMHETFRVGADARPSALALCTRGAEMRLTGIAGAQKLGICIDKTCLFQETEVSSTRRQSQHLRVAADLPCSFCRRASYARACVGRKLAVNSSVLTRWQEWCVPYLSLCSCKGAADVFAVVQTEIGAFVGQSMHFAAMLCRVGAGRFPPVAGCECNAACNNYATPVSQPREVSQGTGGKSQTHHRHTSGARVGRLRPPNLRQCRWIGKRRHKYARNRAAKLRDSMSNRSPRSEAMKRNVDSAWRASLAVSDAISKHNTQHVGGCASTQTSTASVRWRRHEAAIVGTWSIRPRFLGGGRGSHNTSNWTKLSADAQELLHAMLLSCVNTSANVAKAMQQTWVSEWDGWRDFNPDQSETCHAVLSRFLTIAEANAPHEVRADDVRLRELAELGFAHCHASSHEGNT